VPDRDEIDIATFDHRALTLDQINELKSAAFRRAHEAREDYLRSVARGISALLRGLWATPGRIWVRYRAYRHWRNDVSALRRMSDSTLKDIGLTRLDVEALACRRRS
jgi:uncharacterized protein YjiS (DUF1127 family)